MKTRSRSAKTARKYRYAIAVVAFVALVIAVAEPMPALWPRNFGELLSTALRYATMIAVLLVFWWVNWVDERKTKEAAEDPGERLRRRIEAVNSAFAEAAALMEDLQRDLDVQQAIRDTLLADAEHQRKLLELNKEEAEKIRHILVGETEATIRAERRQQWIYIGIGALVSIPIGVAINLLVP
ncbi:hypothetical protein [Nonomuraea sp. NPDC003727]